MLSPRQQKIVQEVLDRRVRIGKDYFARHPELGPFLVEKWLTLVAPDGSKTKLRDGGGAKQACVQ